MVGPGAAGPGVPGLPGRVGSGAGPLGAGTGRGPHRPGESDPAQRDPAQRDQQAFADYVRVLTAWRRLPFLDPGLPAELLPGQWPGLAAAEAFAALRARLAGPARAHVLAVTSRPQ